MSRALIYGEERTKYSLLKKGNALSLAVFTRDRLGGSFIFYFYSFGLARRLFHPTLLQYS